MKTFSLPFLMLLLLSVVTYSGCGDDDGSGNFTADSLRYDGEQASAPFNGEGYNTFAAYFPTQETQPYTGRRLEKISFYLQSIPTSTVVYVYAEGSDERSPGAERYRFDLTQRIRNTGWYEHTITDDVIDIRENEGLWIAVETDLPTNQFQAMGCDNGANYNPNGDRFLPPTGNTWTSFNEITGTEQIHWNIRGFLAEE
ncbi:hypothetical protein FUA23_10315 [Neolewinella aurantiaca]|uniref:Uncharacterized protein n=1 Tax=Neolewinella aurantiaca TaxID=2602767 RepID=A0A5C7FT12_9BACT|nr:hypothetical protein [Neolewinella aurantiaca]TXF89585.1 hypothetical protein FUA23_10315 [Neolewinella aurantiaca]